VADRKEEPSGGEVEPRRISSVASCGKLTHLLDRDLVTLSLKRHQPASTVLMNRHQRRVRLLLERMVHDTHVAQDLTQETFIKVFASLRQYRPDRPFERWLFRIASNVGVDYLRKHPRPMLPLEEADGALISGSSTPSALRTPVPDAPARKRKNGLPEFGKSIDGALDRLRPEVRKCVLLWYEQNSYEEIARVMRRPVGTVKSIIHRTRRKLMIDLGHKRNRDRPDG
jgi:RNA polymerase sigma-70 factor (ECF subfamily)